MSSFTNLTNTKSSFQNAEITFSSSYDEDIEYDSVLLRYEGAVFGQISDLINIINSFIDGQQVTVAKWGDSNYLWSDSRLTWNGLILNSFSKINQSLTQFNDIISD
jgi:hypothetical protein